MALERLRKSTAHVFGLVKQKTAATLTVAKDHALGEFSRHLANRFALHRFGTMTSLNIDTIKKEVRVSLELKGELAPVEITAAYHIERDERGETTLVADSVSTSREWLSELAQSSLMQQKLRIELPPNAALAARILGL
jgi:hypothetical protein